MVTPLTKRQSNLLIFLCWLAYTTAYLGRVNYNANLIRIIDDFGITRAEAGMVSSFFFFSYGAGQLIHGLLNRYYNPRWAIAASLLSSALLNLIVPFSPLPLIKVLWMLNGFAQAVLWSTLARILGQYLDERAVKKSIVAMGTTTMAGTFLSYGSSALLAHFTDWKASFYLATVVLAAVTVFWFVAYGRVTAHAAVYEKGEEARQKNGGKMPSSIMLLFGVILIFAVLNNLIKDGITTWTPSVFKELFQMPDSMSIFLTLGLPMLAMFGSTLVVALNRYIKDQVLLSGVFYAVACCAISAMILLMPLRLWWVTLICFALSMLMMTAVNNIITSLVPLQLRDVADCGRVAGVANGCCYVGSTISSYALGAMADFRGWNGVFYLLLALTAAALLICAVYLLIVKKLKVDRFR